MKRSLVNDPSETNILTQAFIKEVVVNQSRIDARGSGDIDVNNRLVFGHTDDLQSNARMISKKSFDKKWKKVLEITNNVDLDLTMHK